MHSSERVLTGHKTAQKQKLPELQAFMGELHF